MRKTASERGITLIELLIVVAIIGILIAISFGGCVSATRGTAAHAERELDVYAQKMGLDLAGKACVDTDTDSDGYISCTARVRDGDKINNIGLECASGGFFKWTGGCKLALPNFKQ